MTECMLLNIHMQVYTPCIYTHVTFTYMFIGVCIYLHNEITIFTYMYVIVCTYT